MLSINLLQLSPLPKVNLDIYLKLLIAHSAQNQWRFSNSERLAIEAKAYALNDPADMVFFEPLQLYKQAPPLSLGVILVSIGQLEF